MKAHGLSDGMPPSVPPPRDGLRIVRPAVPAELARVRATVSDWGRRAQLPADVLVDLLLAVGEAAANVVDHAYRGTEPGPLQIEAWVRQGAGGRVVVARITDAGHWRPRSAPAVERGRGLPMIRALAAQLDITATGTGTEVCLELTVPD